MSIKNQSKNSNSLNIKQSTYDLIPKIKELAKTMSQKEVQEKLRINKKTLKKIKDNENIKFRTSYLPFEKLKNPYHILKDILMKKNQRCIGGGKLMRLS